MDAHASTSDHSRYLCDLIVEKLRDRGPVPVKHAGKMCSIGSGPVVLYIYHQLKGLTVYLHCHIDDLDHIQSLCGNSLQIGTRKSLESNWAKITPYFVKLSTNIEAERLLPVYQYLASKPRSGRSTARNAPFNFLSEEGMLLGSEEGDSFSVAVSRFERDPKNRSACIRVYGTVCAVCGFDFEKRYGAIGKGYIHVHHLVPLSAAKKRHAINPVSDLRPVCPNCHEMLHKRKPPYTIEELKLMISPSRER